MIRVVLAAALLLVPSAALAAPSAAVVVASPAYTYGPMVKTGERLLDALEADGAIRLTAPALPPAAYRDCLVMAAQARDTCLRDVLETTPGGTPQVVLVVEKGPNADTLALTCVGRGVARVHRAQLSPGPALTEKPELRTAARKARAEAARCLAGARADTARADAGSVPPLVGVWRQELAYDCDGERIGDRSWTPRLPLQELVFTDDGKFTATFLPAQRQADWRGDWRADPVSGHLLLLLPDAPRGLDLDGRYDVDSGAVLRLSDMWLGAPGETGCGATFVRARGRG